MKIIVLGTRGIPNIQGGVETHCEQLYPLIQSDNVQITIIRRIPYVTSENKTANYKGIILKDIYAPPSKYFETFIHTFLGVLYARLKNPDILHIHAVGPSLLTPLAKILGLKVVMTNHGPDYNRGKWGKIAKWTLKTSELLGTKYANRIIVISEVINSILKTKYNRFDANVIYNGVKIHTRALKTDYIDSLGLEKGKYIIGVGRFVEEKGFDDLIECFSNIKNQSVKLVLVGDADHETLYSRKLKEKATKKNIILTGFICGEKLNQTFSFARLFIMPSYHEGLPIALLEAMSYNLDVLVSNIPANLEVNLENEDYFKVGDINDLTKKLEEKLSQTKNRNFENLLKEKYDWSKIAEQTLSVYKSLVP